jgi:membrane protein insertase Oxa1/YidC/SpoIIIJ
MMKYMMPGMMFFFFYNMPSGLTLYVMTSTFAGLLEQKVIRKHIEEKEAAEAAMEVQVDAPGKASRGARTKKPKGPFWFKHG